MPVRARQDRAERTRATILDAATECLVRDGVAGTTMERVQREAGVSRGALTHHFGSMTGLLVAAVQAIAEQTGVEIAEAVDQADATRSIDVLVDSMHAVMHRAVFLAGLELWSAARTDDALRAALNVSARVPSDRMRDIVGRAFDPPLAPAELSLAYDGLMSLLRGLALGSVVRDRPEREKEILRAWLAPFTRPRGAGGPAA